MTEMPPFADVAVLDDFRLLMTFQDGSVMIVRAHDLNTLDRFQGSAAWDIKAATKPSNVVSISRNERD